MSSETFKKAKIIYERLYNEYGGAWGNMEEFAKFLDLTRGGLDYRKKEDVVKPDELERKFPDINKDWLYSYNEDDLKGMPVKNYETGDTEDRFSRLKSYKGEKDMPDNVRDLLLEALEDDAERIQSDFQKMVSLIRKLRGHREDD